MGHAVGDESAFPRFTAPSQDAAMVNLSEYRGGDLVVLFYPKATTRGGVRETSEFRARRHEPDTLGATLAGGSIHDVALQNEHAIQCAANFPRLCDTDKALTTGLGILSERAMAQRTTYVVDRTGMLRNVFPNVAVDGHVGQVVQAVQQLLGIARNPVRNKACPG